MTPSGDKDAKEDGAEECGPPGDFGGAMQAGGTDDEAFEDDDEAVETEDEARGATHRGR